MKWLFLGLDLKNIIESNDKGKGGEDGEDAELEEPRSRSKPRLNRLVMKWL